MRGRPPYSLIIYSVCITVNFYITPPRSELMRYGLTGPHESSVRTFLLGEQSHSSNLLLNPAKIPVQATV
jgi:hypothetical protein